VHAVVALLSLAAAISGALHIRAEYRGPRVQAYFCKPLTTSLILAIALIAPGPAPPLYRALIVAGLAFSLAGDVFLMLPADRFLPGLASFLIAHLIYIAAFSEAAGFQLSLPALLPLAVVAGVLLRILWPHLGGSRASVAVYVAVIATMGWQALAQWIAVGEAWALCAFAGAALFMVSDGALAMNRFRRAFPAAQLAVLGTYYPAQWLIALSVMR
jgi:uncharacterized membrane protein YhhN